MVNEFSFTDVSLSDQSPVSSREEKLCAVTTSWLPQNILSPIYNRQRYMKTSYFLITWKKTIFKNNLISSLAKIVNKRNKRFEEEVKSKNIIIAKLSRRIENLPCKNTKVISWDVQANWNAPAKEPSLET